MRLAYRLRPDTGCCSASAVMMGSQMNHTKVPLPSEAQDEIMGALPFVARIGNLTYVGSTDSTIRLRSKGGEQ